MKGCTDSTGLGAHPSHYPECSTGAEPGCMCAWKMLQGRTASGVKTARKAGFHLQIAPQSYNLPRNNSKPITAERRELVWRDQKQAASAVMGCSCPSQRLGTAYKPPSLPHATSDNVAEFDRSANYPRQSATIVQSSSLNCIDFLGDLGMHRMRKEQRTEKPRLVSRVKPKPVNHP
jgi:hypothetical protein